jgi:ribulose-phosphate 3-epimerase
VKIAPSIMCADFTRLGEQIKDLEAAGADLLHFDIMDNHFVPNLTFGPMVLEACRPLSRLPFYAHLMVERPETLIDAAVEAGADSVGVHVEATPHLHRLVQQIKGRGASACVALNPGTPVAMIEPVIEEVDTVLVMSVNPGWAGQAFVGGSLERVQAISAMVQASGADAEILVDGGITEANIADLRQAGATGAVMGSHLFQEGRSFREAMRALRRAASG